MRTYSGLLIFEDIFSSLPTISDPAFNADISALEELVFSPTLRVVEQDCGTTLGKYEDLTFESEGLTELASGNILTRSRIIQLFQQSTTKIYLRHLSTCISRKGICVECFKATYRDQPVPSVGSSVKVLPEYVIGSDVLNTEEGVATYPLSIDSTQYSKTFAYLDGTLLINGVDYSTSGGEITLIPTPTSRTHPSIKMIREDRTTFLIWMSHTYSGSILGMQPLPAQGLPVRSLLLASLIDENRLQSVIILLRSLPQIPSEYIDYSEGIKDPLEKALYLLAIYSIYYNVST